MNPAPYIYDHFSAEAVPPVTMDRLWAAGWRHFGPRFFRYSLQFDEDSGALQQILPLRIDLARFAFSKSQRRVLRKNNDLRWEIIPARADAETQAMFQRHKMRFKTNRPDHLLDYLYAGRVAVRPCQTLELRAFLDDRLIAASFLAVGETATSSIYGIFEPEFDRRSLGTLTLLKEIEHTAATGRQFHYPGYATDEPSAYDYKKQFAALQHYDWATGQWFELAKPAANR